MSCGKPKKERLWRAATVWRTMPFGRRSEVRVEDWAELLPLTVVRGLAMDAVSEGRQFLGRPHRRQRSHGSAGVPY